MLYVGKVKIVTNSRIKAFRRCNRLHHYQYNIGLKTEPTEAMNLGTAVHSELEFLWENGRLRSGIIERYAEDVDVNVYKIEAMMLGYESYWDMSEYETIAVEQEFRIPLFNPRTNGRSRTYMLSGKIDAIAKKGNEYFVIEHKTTSGDISQGSRYWERLALDEQISIYIHAAQHLGYPVNTCIYDVLKKPRDRKLATPLEKRRYKKDGTLYANQQAFDEDFSTYRTSIMSDIMQHPGKYYSRGMVSRLQRDIEETMLSVWGDAKLITLSNRNKIHARNSQSCFDYNRTCDFFDLCCHTSNVSDDRWVVKERKHTELSEGEDK